MAPLARLYAVWLARLERLIVVLLMAGLVLGGLAVMLELVQDTGTLSSVVYALAFYVCLFGGVIASRKANHIAIDAFTQAIPAGPRLRLEGLIMLLSAAVIVWIGASALEYANVIVQDDSEFVKAMGGGVWAKRVWVWPIGPTFGWMALHFAVGGVVRALGRRPEDIGLVEVEAPA